ncbi:hypothetical protein G7Z17_g5296 [Cylindrodendrum hubeiense]|uniref:EF-hand domain-containing protein n=1 Tax=Cylindrodendrum hubeiense TaxID=595255 RepID=A0A9P5L979_9HYPO|nr:hypothetical protein G7Z17_g5296 [Cylindrodendrum hubeiense]
MAAEAVTEPAAPNLNLSPEEKRAYGQLFRQADTDNVGVVTGEVAVKFFDKTRLNSHVLGELALASSSDSSATPRQAANLPAK